MTLRQSNGQASSCVSTIAWPTSATGASSSSPTVVSGITCTDVQQNGTEHSSKSSKKHSLVDQKRRQWAEEKAEHEEWYPFGRPGGGAPLKSSSERLSQQRLRRLNNTAPSGSCYSDAGASNGSITDFSTLNSSLPGFCQNNAENHCANGRLPQQQQAQAHTAPEPTTYPAGYAYGSNGYYAPYSGVIVSYPTAPVASDSSCQTCPTVGAMANLPNQPAAAAGTHHIHYSPMPLPGAVNVSVGDSAAGHPDVGKHFAVVPPYYPHQQFYGYAAQGMPPVANGMQDPTQGYHVLAPLAPAPVFPTDSSVVSGGRNSLTTSTGSPPYPPQMPSAAPAAAELHRSGMNHQSNGGTPSSYTEHWANQLPLWQDNEPHSPVQRPNNLPVSRQLAPNANGSGAPNPDPTAVMHSPAGPQAPLMAGNTSTPVAYGQHPMAMAMAWVTPIQAKPDNAPRLAMIQQRTAVVSPMHSKAPSLSGNETLDGSANLQFMSASFTGSMPGGGDDSGIHRRRANIAGSKGEHDMEEKQIRMLEHKIALEEQLMEKRRKQFIEEEREKREIERAERERRLIEEKEAMENEQERNRWRKMADQEERREELIMGPLQRAQEEARRARHAKLLRHASRGRQSESDGYESMSPPAATNSNASSRERPLVTARMQDEDVAAPASSTSSGPTVASTTRSQSLPPPAPVVPVMESPADDRPIRPLTKDPLKIWEELGYAAVGEDPTTIQAKRNAPVRQSLRKSRSTEATKLEAIRRSESLERKRTKQHANGEAANGDVNTAVQNGKTPKSKSKRLDDIKDVKPFYNGSFNDRLKSAGLISNATFIIDSKENSIDDLKKHETKSKDAERRGRLASKKKSSNGVDGPMSADHSIDAVKTPESAGKPKLLERRPSAEKPVLPPAVNDNPWGNTLGGLNPLLQPIVTRRRKPRPSLPASTDDPERKLLEDSGSKSLNGSIRARSDSMSDLSQRTTESDTNNNESKKADSKVTNGTTPTGVPVEPKGSKPAYTRAPSLDRFNARSPLYGSISTKMKRPTENQNRLMEQLNLLRQQLKKKQKEVEDGLSSPSQDSASIRD